MLVTDLKSRAVTASERTISYPVHFVSGPVGETSTILEPMLRDRCVLVVTTPTVSHLYRDIIEKLFLGGRHNASVLVLACGEETKNFETMLNICQKGIDIGIDRKGLLVGLGGGVCLDMVGLAASIMRRGIDHLRIPTTLLGQVDAGIGVKCAVNFGGRKSYLGAFRAPAAAVIAPAFLSTLPSHHVRQGFAEIIKMAIVSSERLFDLVEKHGEIMLRSRLAEPTSAIANMIWTSAGLMLDSLELNLFEDKTFKRDVDFGHTFSPALEAASGYALSHGDAVAIDIALSTVIARHMELIEPRDEQRILALLWRLGLPLDSPLLDTELCMRSIADAMLHRGGSPNLVVPTRVGEVTFVEDADKLTAPLISASIASIRKAVQRLQALTQPLAS